jgi:hypothetical protein
MVTHSEMSGGGRRRMLTPRDATPPQTAYIGARRAVRRYFLSCHRNLAEADQVLVTDLSRRAGMSRMRWKAFFLYSAFGGIVWVVVVVLAGYFIGKCAPSR